MNSTAPCADKPGLRDTRLFSISVAGVPLSTNEQTSFATAIAEAGS
jgi:hypothetical protein